VGLSLGVTNCVVVLGLVAQYDDEASDIHNLQALCRRDAAARGKSSTRCTCLNAKTVSMYLQALCRRDAAARGKSSTRCTCLNAKTVSMYIRYFSVHTVLACKHVH
jgi:hypothetical protein